MNLNNVKLIFVREMRDQLRDRRTLFLIAVLPLLLYPLLGMSFFQLSQFMRNTAAKVMVVGADELEGHDWMPPLFHEDRFDVLLFPNNVQEMENLEVMTSGEADTEHSSEEAFQMATAALEQDDIQAVLYFPDGFGERLSTARRDLMQRNGQQETVEDELVPQPRIYYNSANEKSRIAHLRLERVLRYWRNSVMRTNLRDSNVPLEAAEPFDLQPQDVAEEEQRHAAVWSKILPFILFIWALTGAFYPAVDLCAGEKERGTLETLLASPAQRREIVWGKLLTVMTFSIVTALLNLASMGVTGKFVLAQFREISAFSDAGALALPPLISVVWLTLALLPISALFSALCLACAALARSTKEGQYYLMPLLLIVMPLMLLPLSPGVELNLGNSLIPVTGVVLLLRAVIESQYLQALPYAIPVIGITLICCLLAIRWAEEQFNSESVLFREGERLDLGRWIVHLVRDRRETPTFAQAILCIALIMIVQFFVNLALSARSSLDFVFLAKTVFVSQVVCIGFPAVLMTLLFTKNPAKTLLLDRRPKASQMIVAAMLAVAMLPLGQQLAVWIQQLYPYTPEIEVQVKAFSETLQESPYWWLPLLLIAVLPAICEELAFRGFILSGLRHSGHKWWAIGFSAVAFGMAHFFLQQKISAAALGLVIGYLAVQTGSLVPCMIFHLFYNGLTLRLSHWIESLEATIGNEYLFDWVLRDDSQGVFRPWVLIVCLMAAGLCLRWFQRQPHYRTEEEVLHEARERNLARA